MNVFRRAHGAFLALGVAGVMIALGFALSRPTPSHTTSSVSARSSAPSSVWETARHMASDAGDANAGNGAQAVSTTRKVANAATSGDIVTVDQAVYLIQMHGTFVGYSAKVPRGANPPKGSYLQVIVDQADGSILDWGISDHDAGLAALGSVMSPS